MTTLADIAAKLGCSTATVSLALRNDRRVADKTRARVQEVARELGYVPNPSLAALAVRRWGRAPQSNESLIAVVLVGIEASRRQLGRNYFGEPEMIATVKARAARLGYAVEMHRLEDYRSPETLRRILMARGIRGVLLTGAHPPANLDFRFLEDFASVMFGLSFARPFTHAIASDWGAGVQLAISKLRAAGHRRIGLALRPYSLREKRDLILSRALLEFDQLSREVGPQPPVLLLSENEATQKAEFLDWCRRERPDAVLASNSIFYRWLAEISRRRPPEFACLYNQGTGNIAGLQALHHPHDEEGREAVDMLDHLLRYRLFGIPRYPMLILLPPTWVKAGRPAKGPSAPAATPKP
jgi:DNA-binding LacI/PurR family transcriptional regulator